MLRRLATLSFLVLAALVPRAVPAQDDPFAPFDAALLSRSETRLVQAGLSLAGHYEGTLDGAWGSMSAGALAAHREAMGFAPGAPDWEDAALAAGTALDALEADGWGAIHIGMADLSYLAPLGIMRMAEDAEHLTISTPGGSLLIREIYDGSAGTWAMHDWLEDAHVGRERFYRARPDAALVSKGRIAGGRTVYLRSQAAAPGVLVTVLVQWTAAQADRGRLVTASLAAGPQAVPAWGRTLQRAAQAAVIARTEPPPAAPADPPRAAPGAPAAVSPYGASVVAASTGTGFHVSPSEIVTAAHVVHGDCAVIATDDGTVLRLIGRDEETDLAVLSTTHRAGRWLAVAEDGHGRLGSDVFALGFPYGGDFNEGVSVTGGTLSALRSRLLPSAHMISAPVQPGNSGGPVLGRDGLVIGVVIARLDDAAVLADRGSLPQNMNFAASAAALRAFLARHGVHPAPSEPDPLSDGLAPETAAAVVRLTCFAD